MNELTKEKYVQIEEVDKYRKYYSSIPKNFWICILAGCKLESKHFYDEKNNVTVIFKVKHPVIISKENDVYKVIELRTD